MRGISRWPVVLLAASGLVAAGCGDDDMPPAGTDAGVDASRPPPVDGGGVDGGGNDGGGLPATPPTTVSMVANAGFSNPTDAVVSNDGSTIFFAAFNETGDAAIFSVASTGGAPVVVFEGLPLEFVTGLVLALDGDTLYIAAAAGGPDGEGAIFSMPVAGAMPAPVTATGLTHPNALAIDMEGAMLVVSGRVEATGLPGVFKVPVGGGAAVPIASGGNLVSPTGLYADPATDDVWALDHLAEGTNGVGVLWRIHGTDAPVEVVSGLVLGAPGGVSLTAGGGTAVIASRNAAGQGSLVTVDIATMAVGTAADATSIMMVDPAGLRVARGAGVFAIADSEGNAIFSAR